MKTRNKNYVIALLLLTLTIITSCSNKKLISDDTYLDNAEMHERTAKNFRDRGIDFMADYYNDEAQKERDKAIDSCDLLDVALAFITLGYFDCE